MTTQDPYIFGYSQQELARLQRQGAHYGPITRDVFVRAGILAGMRVVDLGCGAGDVALLLAELVGPGGYVLTVDRSPEAIATAQQRASAAGIGWVETQLCDVDDLTLSEPFDAVAGRLVLAYVSQPVALLRRLAASVKPGGILAFVETEISSAFTQPASSLVDKVRDWTCEAMVRGGFEPDMGRRLFAAFAEAGLEAELAAFHVVGGDPLLAEVFRDILEGILPLIEKLGIDHEGADPQRLTAALREEPGAETRVFYMPRLTGAWARTPSEPSAARVGRLSG